MASDAPPVTQVYAGEVTPINRREFTTMYVRDELYQRAMTLFGYGQPGEQASDNMTFNDALAVILERVEDVRLGEPLAAR